jgi:hypothetical protein
LLDLSQVAAFAPERQNAIADLSRQVEQTRRVAESIWTFAERRAPRIRENPDDRGAAWS